MPHRCMFDHQKGGSRRSSAVCAIGVSFCLGILLFSPSAAAIGTIFSGPTSGEPGSVFFNPAAMTLVRGHQLSLSGTVNFLRAQYQAARLDPNTLDPVTDEPLPFPEASLLAASPDPTLSFVSDLNTEKLRIGLGVTLPLGSGAAWDATYGGRPASTRYYALGAQLGQLYIGPFAAYRINKYISVGIGVDFIVSILRQEVLTDFGAKINQVVCKQAGGTGCGLDTPLRREDSRFDGLAVSEGVGFGVGFSAGILLTPTPWLRFGASIHTGAIGGHVTTPSDFTVDVPPALVDTVDDIGLPRSVLPDISAKGDVLIPSPIMLLFGVTAEVAKGLELTFDYWWTESSGNSVFLVAVTHNDEAGLIQDQAIVGGQRDTMVLTGRAEYQILNDLRAAFRFEFSPNARPETFVSPVAIDFDKVGFGLGAAWSPIDWLTISLQYTHFVFFGRTVTQSEYGPIANPTTPEIASLDKPDPSGRYSAQADRFGLGMIAKF